MKCRIKKGAIVGQDFSCYKWGNDRTIFTVTKTINGRKQCTADGYGSFAVKEEYGNGCVYALENDLMPAYENGWVRIEDRLPAAGYVIAKKTGILVPEIVAYEDGEFISLIGTTAVTHWHPLPEPPDLKKFP
jgi:hypothetical protein